MTFFHSTFFIAVIIQKSHCVKLSKVVPNMVQISNFHVQRAQSQTDGNIQDPEASEQKSVHKQITRG